MDAPRHHRISAIMAKKAAGGITQTEQKILNEWMGESPVNKETYDRFMSGASHAGRLGGISEEFICKVEKKIRRRTIRRIMARGISVAAVLAVGLFMAATIKNSDAFVGDVATIAYHNGAVLLLEDGSKFILKEEGEDEWKKIVKAGTESDSIFTIKVEVPRGYKYKIRLDDGTVVWLNVESTIEYPSKFTGDERKVRVKGEAYFDVAHNPLQPFIVTMGEGLDIAVLGTRFNVNNYADVPEVQVTLVEGSVSLRQNERDFILAPGQQGVFVRENETLCIHEVDAERNIAWINGIFDFRSKSLYEIHNQLASWYNIEFIFEDTGHVDMTSPSRYTLTADRGNDFMQIREILQKITGLQYRIDGNRIYVSGK